MSATGLWQIAAPLVVAGTWALLVLAVDMFSSTRRYVGIAWMSVLGLALIAWAALTRAQPGLFTDAIAVDGLTVFATVLVCAAAAASVWMTVDYLPLTSTQGGEAYPLLMFSVLGAVFVTAATDLIVVFIAVETLSITAYVLAGIDKRSLRSNEAALKYFLLGAFASGFLLYGIALIYAATGSTVLSEIRTSVSAHDGGVLVDAGLALVLVGFGFKISAVPFHLWTPDVYEGAPTPITAFMATVVKAAAVTALVRTVTIAFGASASLLPPFLWAAAAVTMTVGNVVALQQTNLKRMLAYSSIAHTGYLLVGLTPATADGATAVLFYLAAYAAMNLGAFGVLMLIVRRDGVGERIADLAGLGRRSPLLALAMTVSMLSLTGIPPLAGFFGKLYLFAAALGEGYVVLVVIAAANSVVSAAYYLGVVRAMYFDAGGAAYAGGRPYLSVATAVAVIVTLALGLAPAPVFEAARVAVATVLLGP